MHLDRWFRRLGQCCRSPQSMRSDLRRSRRCRSRRLASIRAFPTRRDILMLRASHRTQFPPSECRKTNGPRMRSTRVPLLLLLFRRPTRSRARTLMRVVVGMITNKPFHALNRNPPKGIHPSSSMTFILFRWFRRRCRILHLIPTSHRCQRSGTRSTQHQRGLSE